MYSPLFSHLSLVGALFGFDLVEIVKWGGVVGLTIIIFAESGLLIGFFLPGDSLLFTAGFLAQTKLLSINIFALVTILFLAATLGDSVGYMFGRRVGRKLFERPNARFFKQDHVKKAEAFYRKHGGKTIILARFTPFVRTFAPIIAGTAKMPYRTFLTFNVIGALIWAVGITFLGYFLGGALIEIGLDIDTVILPVVFVIIFLSLLPPIVHIMRDKSQRQAAWAATKLQYKKLLKKDG